MSDTETRNFYRIDVETGDDGSALLNFVKVDIDGVVVATATQHPVSSNDGLVDALRGLADGIENAEVSVFADDEDERADRLTNWPLVRDDCTGDALPIIIDDPANFPFEPGEREHWHPATEEQIRNWASFWDRKDRRENPSAYAD